MLKRTYRVEMKRLAGPDEWKELETKFVDVEARSRKGAALKAILEVAGLWTVFDVHRLRKGKYDGQGW